MGEVNIRSEVVKDLDRIIGSCKNLTDLNNLKVIMDKRFEFFLKHYTRMEEHRQDVKINYEYKGDWFGWTIFRRGFCSGVPVLPSIWLFTYYLELGGKELDKKKARRRDKEKMLMTEDDIIELIDRNQFKGEVFSPGSGA